jgi:hypothetical protein
MELLIAGQKRFSKSSFGRVTIKARGQIIATVICPLAFMVSGYCHYFGNLALSFTQFTRTLVEIKRIRDFRSLNIFMF